MAHREKAHAMRALEEEILSLNITPELAAQANRLVIGDGSLDADIVFIGEAPGKNEDLKGIPFVGAAGKFLNVMLEAAGMVRSDVYITNIVKYRPPENRDPTTAEKAAFWPYLLRQLEIIKPTVVITLGRHSMEYFLPGEKIGEVHGQPKRLSLGDSMLIVMPLYHPAAAMYNGSLRQTLIDDFLKVPEVIRSFNETT
jgi:uracil-DNA glycosylase family 4